MTAGNAFIVSNRDTAAPTCEDIESIAFVVRAENAPMTAPDFASPPPKPFDVLSPSAAPFFDAGPSALPRASSTAFESPSNFGTMTRSAFPMLAIYASSHAVFMILSFARIALSRSASAASSVCGLTVR